MTSELTLLEVLVIPYRLGRMDLAARCETIISASEHLSVVAVDLRHLREAASVRARYRLRTPDAIQLATAKLAGCTSFLTNDHRLPAVPGLRIVAVTDLSGS